jgi:heptosyltransferase-2
VPSPERIFVRLPNWLGDVLMARPLLHALRAAHPRARVIGVAPAPLLSLLAADRVIDESVPLRGPAPPAQSVAGVLARLGPDAALALPSSFSSAWLAFRSGARVRIGFRGEGRDFLLTHALPRPARGDMHLSREYLSLGSALGVRPPGSLPALASPPAGDAGERLVAGSAAGFAILGPGATFGPAKRWAPDRFAAVGRRLAGRGLEVLVCGIAAERDLCRTVVHAIGEGARTLAGETDLPAQAALCARASLAVCNDSGLAHLAAAMGTPTVAIFGSTSSAWTAPLGPRVRVVQRAPVCSPCFQRRCRIGTVCLEAIEVDHVMRACDEIAAWRRGAS